MTSDYNPLFHSQTFEQWLDEVIQELADLGYDSQLTIQSRNWLFNTWENYDLSVAEAALSFVNEVAD